MKAPQFKVQPPSKLRHKQANVELLQGVLSSWMLYDCIIGICKRHKALAVDLLGRADGLPFDFTSNIRRCSCPHDFYGAGKLGWSSFHNCIVCPTNWSNPSVLHNGHRITFPPMRPLQLSRQQSAKILIKTWKCTKTYHCLLLIFRINLGLSLQQVINMASDCGITFIHINIYIEGGQEYQKFFR